MAFLSIFLLASVSSSSSLVMSSLWVSTSIPKYLVAQSTLELGSSSLFSSYMSKAIFMVLKVRVRK